MSKLLKTLQKNLKDLMHEKKLSQSELARRSGIRQQHVSRILGEGMGVTLSTLERLSKGLNTPAYKLLVAGNEEELTIKDALRLLERAITK